MHEPKVEPHTHVTAVAEKTHWDTPSFEYTAASAMEKAVRSLDAKAIDMLDEAEIKAEILRVFGEDFKKDEIVINVSRAKKTGEGDKEDPIAAVITGSIKNPTLKNLISFHHEIRRD
jgi:hypothetical protein